MRLLIENLSGFFSRGNNPGGIRSAGISLPLIVFSAVYYSLLIFLAAYLNIWEDEVYSMNTSSGSLKYAFNQSYEFELQPPVYFLLLTIWRTFSASVFWARLLSVIAVFLSQLFLYRFVKKITDQKTATFLVVLFLLNPVIVYTALEIRTFAFVLFLSVVIIISFYNTYYSDKITFKSRILFMVLAAAGLFTQYFVGFLLFANAIVLVAGKKWKTLGAYITDMIVPLVLLLLFIPKIMAGAGVQASSFPEYSRTFKDFILEIKGMAGQITFGYFFPLDFADSGILQKVLKAGVLLLLLISLYFSGIKKSLRQLFPFFLISLVIFFFFIIVLWLYGRYAVEKKYLLVLFPALFMILITFFRSVKPGIQYLLFFIFSMIYLVNDVGKYHELYKVKDFRSLAGFLEESEKRNEPVFVFRNISAENLKYYYNGVNEIIPVPDGFSYNEAFGQNQWNLTEEYMNGLEGCLQKYSEFYLVIDNSPLRGVNESRTLLLDFLYQRYSNVFEQAFRGKLILYKFSNKENKLSQL